MKGIEKLPDVFQQLADWVSVEYDIEVLNILYATIESGSPRITLVLRSRNQVQKLMRFLSHEFTLTAPDR